MQPAHGPPDGGGTAAGPAGSPGAAAFVPLLLALASLLLAGCATVRRPPPPGADRAPHNLLVYERAADLVEARYFDAELAEVNWDDLRARHRAAAGAAKNDAELYASINALLDALKDGHTGAIAPAAADRERRREGVLVGLILRPDPGDARHMLVVDTIPGSAAAELAIQPGWVLVACDGRPPRDVLGPGRLNAGQAVQCEFLDRSNARVALALEARRLSTRPLRVARVLPGGIVHLRFDRFDTDSARWVRGQLHEHAGAPGVIVDLRTNPGGDAFALARILGEFFRHGAELGTFVSRRGFDFNLRAWQWLGSARYGGAVAVLVSENSASSSEIFACVMQHHGRGTVIGSKTAGVVLGSRTFSLPDGGRLQISIDDYHTPAGTRLEGIGVTPDLLVPQTVEDLRAGRDAPLEAAMERLQREKRGAETAARPSLAGALAA